MKEKSYVADINRSIYDIRDEEKDAYKLSAGLTPQIVEQLSKEKQDPHGWSCSVCALFRSTMK